MTNRNPNAEAQRRWRAKQKQKRLEALKQPDQGQSDDLYRQPFFESKELDLDWFNFVLPLDLAGMEPPDFDDDSGPKSNTGDHERASMDAGNEPFEGKQNSLAKAEVVVGCLIDAASELAGIVNKYKRREIGQRIDEIEESDLFEADRRKEALEQLVRLTKLRDELDKEIRWAFRRWKTEMV